MLPRKKLIKPIAIDQRGKIINVLEEKITSVLVIFSKKGSVRANHYHRQDSHYVYMITGKMGYTHQDLRGKTGRKLRVMLRAGEMIYTPPMVAHAMEFLEDSIFLALTAKTRKQKAYEADTVRVKLV